MVIVTKPLPGQALQKYFTGTHPKSQYLHMAIKFSLDMARTMNWLHANGVVLELIIE